ncbi:MAG: hypothetical protein JWN29_3168 [Acidimicrobiales bacterium]|nr:hypothetical protein [Acidimicrobiales bacterium]
MRGLGTFVNVAAVLAGTGIGLVVGGRLAERVRTTVLDGIGLLTICVGVAGFLETRNAVFVVFALVIGTLVGEGIDVEGRLDGLGERLRRRAAREGDDRFVLGFVTASLTFCVGALTIVGSLRDGISGDAQLLIVKSALDGVVAVVYAAAFGWGVAFSALTILVVQGGFTLLGVFAGDAFLTTRMVAELEATGGVLIAGIGLRLLDLRPVRVASMLPALVVAPVLVAIFAR